jgi:hypothetical protein
MQINEFWTGHSGRSYLRGQITAGKDARKSRARKRSGCAIPIVNSREHGMFETVRRYFRMPEAAAWRWPFKMGSSDVEDHRIPRRDVSSSEIASNAAALRRIDIGGGRGCGAGEPAPVAAVSLQVANRR